MTDFPSKFAKRFATQTGMFDADFSPSRIGSCNQVEPELARQYHAWTELKEFQETAVANSFENSLYVFVVTELTEEQKVALKLIHENTQKEVKGDVINALITRVHSITTDNKNFVDICNTLLLALDDTGDMNNKNFETAKKFIVKVSS